MADIPITDKSKVVKVKLPPNWDQMTDEEKTNWVLETNDKIERGEEVDEV